jgi:hypothetical protein
MKIMVVRLSAMCAGVRVGIGWGVERWRDVSDGSLRQIVVSVQRIAMHCPESAPRRVECMLPVDALATMQALGVHRDGRVTGAMEEVILDL